MKEEILCAARATGIPEGWSNLWYISKIELSHDTPSVYRGRGVTVPAGIYTHLRRLTDSTLYNAPAGEVVMEDTPFELRTHLNFMMKASGRVLVTGLGLGCVVRGLLANPSVEHVTCIENSPDVLKLVQPHMPQTDRLEIIEADAFEWANSNKRPFDYAWHDLWTDRDGGEPNLNVWHVKLLFNCKKWTRVQGAWDMPRSIYSRLRQAGLELV